MPEPIPASGLDRDGLLRLLLDANKTSTTRVVLEELREPSGRIPPLDSQVVAVLFGERFIVPVLTPHDWVLVASHESELGCALAVEDDLEAVTKLPVGDHTTRGIGLSEPSDVRREQELDR